MYCFSVECLLEDQTANKGIKTDIGSRDKGLAEDTSQNGFEATESSSKVKKKKKQKRVTAENQKIKTKALNNESSIGRMTDSIKKQNHKTKDIHKAKSKEARFSDDKDRGMAEDKGFTDDGFKIVSSIPEDDSDVSDAFESCSEEEDDPVPTHCPRQERDVASSRKPQETEDGFKIVAEIPPDDSDVSDAFEDEDNFVSVSLPDRQKHIKKPLMQIMNDFGKDMCSLWDGGNMLKIGIPKRYH